ncbi:unnamed protein product [Amoebophrya sp. A25]|nr:unnamed protein product [Amoebophrya sp. A25]|eukprot:GSA25T00015895001.1
MSSKSQEKPEGGGHSQEAEDGGGFLVLDKGTLDALDSEADREAMFLECAKLLVGRDINENVSCTSLGTAATSSPTKSECSTHLASDGSGGSLASTPTGIRNSDGQVVHLEEVKARSSPSRDLSNGLRPDRAPTEQADGVEEEESFVHEDAHNVVSGRGQKLKLEQQGSKNSDNIGETERCHTPAHALFVSVSFAAVARLRFLERMCAACGLWCDVYVVGDGDPARGGEVRFVAVMGTAGIEVNKQLLRQDGTSRSCSTTGSRDSDDTNLLLVKKETSASNNSKLYTPDDLTQTVLSRARKCGSIIFEQDEGDEIRQNDWSEDLL